jgi:alpha-ribazole phosphatase
MSAFSTRETDGILPKACELQKPESIFMANGGKLKRSGTAKGFGGALNFAGINTLVLIRHAETALAGRFCGRLDPDLNAAGEAQLSLIVEQLASLQIERICCSDLLRASRTAAAISQRIGVLAECRSGLQEMDFGLWEGMTWTEIEDRFPWEAERWLRHPSSRSAPGGEHYEDFVARVEEELTTLVCQSPHRTIALVTHLGVIQCILTRFFNVIKADAWRLSSRYGAVIVARRVHGEWQVST